ncbi:MULTISPECIES: nuclease-related domain-containing protein [Niallia]|jgi:hypothetical protein|uniref:nuclease-related domain-containing protein n=1 Tax=Niallia TaxID=2837506 RepID=UPI0013D4A2E4|nr:nuclease-related domain-containing protein [Niallia circulans]NRG27615.1 NERD domain-containing protein [Niallia circulans]QJX63809.1 NERD domain-containing protein [Niallia circulans]
MKKKGSEQLIVKPIEYPHQALQLEALLSRIRANHPNIPLINQDYQRKLAGYRGEKAVDFPLSFLPNDEYFILHDLRLWDGKRFFQIDVLILHAKYALILEVKNIIGELYFDTDLHQMIRIKEEEKEAFPDPIIQVNRLKRQFEGWLLANQFPAIPIYALIVFSNPKSILRLSSPQIQTFKNTIIHKEYLPELIPKLTSSYKKSFLLTEERKRLIKCLKRKNTPLDTDILQKYQVEKRDIISGVKCESCNQFLMCKQMHYWYCPSCSNKSKNAILPTLKDYYLLFGEKISNSQLRQFMQVDSIYIASRILANLKLKRTGCGKKTIHHLTLTLFKSVLGGK